jgi:hypothetical protein
MDTPVLPHSAIRLASYTLKNVVILIIFKERILFPLNNTRRTSSAILADIRNKTKGEINLARPTKKNAR